MTIDEYIEQRLEKLKGEIVGNMASKKINASGRTASSFRVEKYDNGFRLIGGGCCARTSKVKPASVRQPSKGGMRAYLLLFLIIYIWAQKFNKNKISEGNAFQAEKNTKTHLNSH